MVILTFIRVLKYQSAPEFWGLSDSQFATLLAYLLCLKVRYEA